MNKPLLYSFMTLFLLILFACGKKGVDSNIQRYLNTHYKKLRLTVVETAKLPYNNYYFWATDKQGITVKGVWYPSNKETNDIHTLYEEAFRRHSITDYIKQELSGTIKVDVYTGNTEQEFSIYCMEVPTAANKHLIINKLRLALDKTAASYNLTHYQASLRFTWQGTPPREGTPTVRETPTNYYNTWLFALLEGPGSEEVPYFHLTGTYANNILLEKLTQKAIEINNTIYSPPVFFQIEQQSLSEIVASFSIRSEKPEERSQLFLVYDPTTETIREYNVITLPFADKEGEDETAGFADYIPERFRYQETLLKHSGLFREVY